MAYVELTKEEWDDVIRAAANKAGSVAGVVNRCGGFKELPDPSDEPEVVPAEKPSPLSSYSARVEPEALSNDNADAQIEPTG